MTDADRKRLLELAERCEREEPSAELDLAVEKACKGLLAKQRWWPTYTTSLDAAVTLVPEGVYEWQAGTSKGGGVAGVYHPAATKASWKAEGKPKTPALALCASALRARAALLEET